MSERPHPLRVFLDVRDPWARRLLRDALSHDPQLRFVGTASGADILIGDQGATRAIQARSEPLVAPPSPTHAAEPSQLTEREHDVLQALAEGLSNGAMAERLGISTSTVKFHLAALFAKLGVHNRAEAVAAGVRRGEVLL